MSDEKKEKSPLDLIEERREARRAAKSKGRDAQFLLDMTELDKLEEEHGPDNVKALHAASFVEGLPTFIVVKSPGGTSYHKRFVDSVRKANGHKQLEAAAQDQLARASIVYPTDAAVMGAMLEAFPNMLNDASGAAVEFVKLRADDEKKG